MKVRVKAQDANKIIKEYESKGYYRHTGTTYTDSFENTSYMDLFFEEIESPIEKRYNNERFLYSSMR